MNERYLEYYVDIDGNSIRRSRVQSLNMVLFAGTKFFCDRLFALIGLTITSPLLIIIAILIKLDSRGPVFFRQIRTGKNGKEFTIYKFRTMVASNDVHDFRKKDEPTRFGKLLRKTSLDELPQLISIFEGKMSFIGPRPWIPDYYENMNVVQKNRCAVRPGLTGLAQVMGRNNLSIIKKINYDLEYIKNYSLSQDIKIILLTIKTIFTGNGATAGKKTIKKELWKLRRFNKKRTERK